MTQSNAENQPAVLDRVGNLDFLRPNSLILAFLLLVWPLKKWLAFWLYFGFFIE